jgi:hypothetical protein
LSFDRDANGAGAYFVGDPEEIAGRIVALHQSVGYMRQFFQMNIGHLPQKDYLRSIELLGTRVKAVGGRRSRCERLAEGVAGCAIVRCDDQRTSPAARPRQVRRQAMIRSFGA